MTRDHAGSLTPVPASTGTSARTISGSASTTPPPAAAGTRCRSIARTKTKARRVPSRTSCRSSRCGCSRPRCTPSVNPRERHVATTELPRQPPLGTLRGGARQPWPSRSSAPQHRDPPEPGQRVLFRRSRPRARRASAASWARWALSEARRGVAGAAIWARCWSPPAAHRVLPASFEQVKRHMLTDRLSPGAKTLDRRVLRRYSLGMRTGGLAPTPLYMRSVPVSAPK